MRTPRIYQNTPLSLAEVIELTDDAFGHVIRVLRLQSGDQLILFNGEGQEFLATLTDVGKKSARVELIEAITNESESPLSIHLGQGISRGDRMDFTIQKSVELGVTKITPLFTERCGVKLSGERLAKKQAQWQKIVISACEQSGRSLVPEVCMPVSLAEWLAQPSEALKLNLHPKATQSIMHLASPVKNVRLVIGPEGGLSDEEIDTVSKHGFQDVLLGPRVLRTETAALTAITALQCKFGDLA